MKFFSYSNSFLFTVQGIALPDRFAVWQNKLLVIWQLTVNFQTF